MGGFVGLVYPLADVTTQWWEHKYSRAQFSIVEKLLLHSTETKGWPSYHGDGSDAPTLTYHPLIRKWRQHNYINTSARALSDPDSTPIRENRDNVVQIEIVGYTDEILADSVGGLKISQLTDAQLQDIADFYKWLNGVLGCPIQCTLEFPPYRPYKNVHLTSSQYDAYKGLMGHMHVPTPSTHTDPGNINVSKIISLALGENEMQANDVIPGTNPPMTWAQAASRGNYAYQQIVEGGYIDERIDRLVTGLDELKATVAALPTTASATDVSTVVTAAVEEIKNRLNS